MAKRQRKVKSVAPINSPVIEPVEAQAKPEEIDTSTTLVKPKPTPKIFDKNLEEKIKYLKLRIITVMKNADLTKKELKLIKQGKLRMTSLQAYKNQLVRYQTLFTDNLDEIEF